MLQNHNERAYVGTYTNGDSKGIYTVYLDTKTGKLKEGGLVAELQSPSYLAITKDNRALYAVQEAETLHNQVGGGVAGYAIDETTGQLSPLNSQPTTGTAPCHITVDSLSRYLFAANYGNGTVSAFILEKDGSIHPRSMNYTHQGMGPNAKRQKGPHAHNVELSPDEQYLCAVDLGIDRIMLYPLEDMPTTFAPKENLSVAIQPGSGPRHLTFHPNGRFAYLINELSSDVVFLTYDAQNGVFTQHQTISTLPSDYTDANSCAAIHIAPDGSSLYASNRGHDSLAVYQIDPSSGKLALVEHTKTLGKSPRDFAIHPEGKFLLVAHQDSDTIVSFSITEKTGQLKVVDTLTGISSPVCIKFLNRI